MLRPPLYIYCFSVHMVPYKERNKAEELISSSADPHIYSFTLMLNCMNEYRPKSKHAGRYVVFSETFFS